MAEDAFRKACSLRTQTYFGLSLVPPKPVTAGNYFQALLNRKKVSEAVLLFFSKLYFQEIDSLRVGSLVWVGYRGQRRQRQPRTGEVGEKNAARKSGLTFPRPILLASSRLRLSRLLETGWQAKKLNASFKFACSEVLDHFSSNFGENVPI